VNFALTLLEKSYATQTTPRASVMSAMPRNLLPKAMNCLNRASIAFVRLGRFSKIASPRPPSLEDLARTVGTNAKRLSKDFQILHGMTVFA